MFVVNLDHLLLEYWSDFLKQTPRGNCGNCTRLKLWVSSRGLRSQEVAFSKCIVTYLKPCVQCFFCVVFFLLFELPSPFRAHRRLVVSSVCALLPHQPLFISFFFLLDPWTLSLISSTLSLWTWPNYLSLDSFTLTQVCPNFVPIGPDLLSKIMCEGQPVSLTISESL